MSVNGSDIDDNDSMFEDGMDESETSSTEDSESNNAYEGDIDETNTPLFNKKNVVAPSDRRTRFVMTVFEYTRVIGEIAEMISNGVIVPSGKDRSNVADPYNELDLATHLLNSRDEKIKGITIARPYGNKYEYFKISELKFEHELIINDNYYEPSDWNIRDSLI